MATTEKRELGLGRGKVYPARHARQLRNPIRNLIQSPARLVGSLPLAAEDVILELGCGPGFFSPTLAAKVSRGWLHLFDFQAEMLQMARERLTKAGIRRFDCVRGDGQALPYRGGQFDLVLLVTVLGEVPDRLACLREVRRVLRPTGHLAISESRTDPDFHSLAALRSLADEAGFQFVRSRGPRWNYTAIFARPADIGTPAL